RATDADEPGTPRAARRWAVRRGTAGRRPLRNSNARPGRARHNRDRSDPHLPCPPCTTPFARQPVRAALLRSIPLLQPFVISLLDLFWILLITSMEGSDTSEPMRSALLLSEQRIEALLESVVVDAIVELHAGLHGIDHILLRAVAPDRGIDVLRRLVHGAESRQRIEHQGNVYPGQLLGGVQRRGAEFGDVGQDRRF